MCKIIARYCPVCKRITAQDKDRAFILDFSTQLNKNGIYPQVAILGYPNSKGNLCLSCGHILEMIKHKESHINTYKIETWEKPYKVEIR